MSLSDLLRDKEELRLALAQLDNRELGVVLGLALSALDDRGESGLSDLLRELADHVDSLRVSDRFTIEPSYVPADGDATCMTCGFRFRSHPVEQFGDLTLHRICGGAGGAWWAKL